MRGATGHGTRALRSAHTRVIWRGRHLGDFHQLDIEDQVGFRGNSRMRRAACFIRGAIGDHTRSIGELPRNEQAALAANLHSAKSLIEARNEAAHALGKRHGLRFSQLGFAILAEHRLAVFVFLWLAGVIERGVEFDAVCGAIAGVIHLIQLAGLGVGASADLDVLVFQRERALHHAPDWRYSGRQRDGGSGGFWGSARRFGGGDWGFGGSLGTSSKDGCRRKEEKNNLFHWVVKLQ